MFPVLSTGLVNGFSVGWSNSSSVHGFGESPSVKAQILNLIRSIRTVTRSMYPLNVNKRKK